TTLYTEPASPNATGIIGFLWFIAAGITSGRRAFRKGPVRSTGPRAGIWYPGGTHHRQRYLLPLPGTYRVYSCVVSSRSIGTRGCGEGGRGPCAQSTESLH